MTYGALSAVFVATAALVALTVGAVDRRRARPGRFPGLETPAPVGRIVWAVSLTALALVVLTAVFDNLMIAAGLFAYSDAHVSGLRVGRAPLEDFTYPLAGAMLLPALWLLIGRRR